ncbi:Von willebrand factor a domain-containing protein 8, partial [Globisporangium splendens]
MRLFSTSTKAAAKGSLKIMFLGAPGAGKGTYASRIAPMLNIPTISTGDLVRYEIKTGTHLGEQIKSYNDRGALVPDRIILDMDGFPRNVPQAEAFQKVTALDLVVNIDLPQWILTEKISGRRVCTSCGSGFNVAHINHGEYNMPPLLPKVDGVCDSCGTPTLVQRPDDNADVVRQRLEVYNDETAPLIDFYTAVGSLRTFEVKKGLADLDKLIELIETELAASCVWPLCAIAGFPAEAHLAPNVSILRSSLRAELKPEAAADTTEEHAAQLGAAAPAALDAHAHALAERLDSQARRAGIVEPFALDAAEGSVEAGYVSHWRREITGGAAIFTDQAPVRAAIHGRVLVIDGLEKAERNVLPTLNNLLENREMTLDDGRFLMKAESYDALLAAGYSAKDLDAQNLVRVHPDFRVIALGLPVPPYPGRTLDPPLRSRFQARNVQPSSPGTQLEALVSIAPNVPISTLERLVGVREAVNAIEAMHDGITGQRMPHFDYLSLSHCAKVMESFPNASLPSTVKRVFPVRKDILGTKAASNSDTLNRILKKFGASLPESKYTVQSVAKHSPSDLTAMVTFESSVSGKPEKTVLDVPCGTTTPHTGAMKGFVETDLHSAILTEMIQDHAAGSDLCILGEKGSGKSDLARLFAHRLGYATELFSLFKDMTARDLLQRRATDSHGNTRWEDSPLIHAARNGHIAVLDGVHRLGSDSLSVLQRLMQDREIDLADGTKLLAQSKYDEILEDAKESGAKPSLDRVFPIHPSFRIIAIAESDPSTLKSAPVPGRESSAAWLNSDSIAMFTFHYLPNLSKSQSEQVVRSLYPKLPDETTRILLSFSEQLRKVKDTSADNDYLSLNLSSRQLLRACRRLNAFPEQSLQDLRPLLHDTLLTQFLPSSCARLVDTILDDCGIPATAHTTTSDKSRPTDTIREESGKLCIGDVCHPIQTPANPELVPQPHYFDIPKHTKTMKEMLQDVVAGQKHMLLIGNQGVGKNKLADRLLQLLQQEREYIQLHRDTTVQTLTLVPSLVDGKIVWEDSPLVRAAKTGRTLLVDEADKAPLEVVCVLKGLIEDGEMLLGNGKRLIDPNKVAVEEWHDEDKIIRLHPEFRMWVLANRPGFPFLGNNFFREIGDVFASHAIENPDEESELALLKAYAPNVPVDILRRLCKAFAELRELVDKGVITYPYSTREAVAVAKHLEQFPNDGVTSVLENVLAFDAYDTNLRKQLSEVFLSHGIPLSLNGEGLELAIELAEPIKLPEFTPTETWNWKQAAAGAEFDFSPSKSNKNLGLYQSPLQRRDIWLDPATSRTFSLRQHRLQTFTEEVASFQVPLKANRKQKAHAMAVFPDNSIHGLCVLINPLDGSDGRTSCFTIPDKALSGQVHADASSRSSSSSTKTPFGRWFGGSSPTSRWKVVTDGSNPGMFVRFEQGGSIVQVVDINTNHLYSMDLQTATMATPVQEVVNVQSTGKGEWIVHTTDESVVYSLTRAAESNKFVVREADIVRSNQVAGGDTRMSIFPASQPSDSSASRLMVHPEAFLQSLEAQDSSFNVQSALRGADATRWGIQGAWTMDNGRCIVNAKSDDDQVDIEVAYPDHQSTKTIVLASTSNEQSNSTTWSHSSGSLPRIAGASGIHDGKHLVTLQEEGDVRFWQLDQDALDKEAKLWKQMFGVEQKSKLQLKLDGQAIGNESTPKTGLDTPKYGKEDPKNEPHVGGNTWAGGTGGSDTAGLGGRGGPYRLDKGHPVHQVSQAKKDEVSAETRAKARAMAEEALAAKLEEIDMSEREWKTYQSYFGRVERESAQLRSILDNLESGELDDAKLVDGVTGERLVFKKRGVSDSPFQSMHQTKPKRMLFVMDVSGSMYRFNGQDQRLERVLETSLMIMESFAGFENKFDYCIMGHSGDSPDIPFVDFGHPPADRKERLKILQKMVAHTQYCSSGDHTVEAIDHAVKRIVEEDGDDYYVFVVSDANLERYNIHPKRMSQKLIADSRVKAHAIFIASFAGEAARIRRDLPQGRGHVCLDTAELPLTFKKIFTSAFGN